MACRSLAASPTWSHALLRSPKTIRWSRTFFATSNQLADDFVQTPSTRSSPSITTDTSSSATTTSSFAPPTSSGGSTPPGATGKPATAAQRTAAQRNSILEVLSSVGTNLGGPSTREPSAYGLTSTLDKYKAPEKPQRQGDDEWHLHVYSTKHNTHLTLAGTDRKSIISISTGNLGFRKAQRGSYDAGFQLMAYLLSRIQQQGLMSKIQKLELCLRGFGQGREAVTKVLLGVEGTRLREVVVRVVDKTRLKIGGNRSPRPRRLG